MSSSNVLDQTSTTNASSCSATSNHPTNTNNINSNSHIIANNINTAFQPVRSNLGNMGQTFENSMQVFAMKQQPMASPITGTIYAGPPAKYLSNGGMNSNGYIAGGPMRPILPPQQQNRYRSVNGNISNSGPLMQQPRRQNNTNVDNATNDSLK